MVTKNVLAKILDTWGSWAIFFDSLSVSGQNMGGVKMKMHKKIAFFGYFSQNLGLIKKFSMWVTKKFPEIKTNVIYMGSKLS